MVRTIPADDPQRPVVALVTHPPDGASALAERLVAERLAACVNLVPSIRSVYRWHGEVATDEEHLLIVKTTRDRLEEIGRLLAAEHPYEVPELVVVPVVAGSESYLEWLAAASRAERSPLG